MVYLYGNHIDIEDRTNNNCLNFIRTYCYNIDVAYIFVTPYIGNSLEFHRASLVVRKLYQVAVATRAMVHKST